MMTEYKEQEMRRFIDDLQTQVSEERERADGYFKAMRGYEKLLADLQWHTDCLKLQLIDKENITAQKIARWCKRHAYTAGTLSNRNSFDCLNLYDVLKYLNKLMSGEVKNVQKRKNDRC